MATTGQSSFSAIKVGATTPVDPSAIIDMVSTTQGMLVPRMTTTQRLAISSPATGLQVYDIVAQAIYVYGVSGGWTKVGAGSGGTVTSVALADGSTTPIFTVSGSPITGSGTLTETLVTQSANQVFAGPTGGSAAQPAFRALNTSDIPSGLPYVTSVGISAPSQFSYSANPVTGSGTLTITQNTQPANDFFAGPVSGSNATPTFRAITTADVPTLNQNTTGTATNITATSNSTLTGLSSLIVTGSQVSGNISGNASNITGTSNATLTTLSALTTASSLNSVGTISGGTWNSSFGANIMPLSGVNQIATNTILGNAASGTANIAALSTAQVTSIVGASTPTASTLTTWDSNLNLHSNNMIDGFAATATTGTTTTLTVSSASIQYFTGSTTQTCQMPAVSTLVNGMQWTIINVSTGSVTVQTSGANTIQVLPSMSQVVVTCISIVGGTGTASWSWVYSPTLLGAAATYYSGYMGSGSSWSTASTGYNDPANSGGNTLTSRQSSGITVTAAASNLPGITFTPSSASAVYLITALVAFTDNSSGDTALQYQLTDGTTVISSPGPLALGAVFADSLAPMPVGGIYAPNTTSAVTVKVQLGAIGGASAEINTTGTGTGNSIEWTIIQINPPPIGNIALTTQVTGILPVANGGTGFSDYAAYGIVSSNQAISGTGGTLVNATSMGFTILASESWTFEFHCIGFPTVTSTGGKFGINGPSGATVVATAHGVTSAVGTYTQSFISTLNSASLAFCTATGVTGFVKVWGTMVASATSGTCQLQFAPNTTGDAFTLVKGSYMVAQRIS